MAIKITQGQKQIQSLMMTPQLQQAIKLLSLTHYELAATIAHEMEENPVLEEAGSEMEVGEERREAAEREQDPSAGPTLERELSAESFAGPNLIQKDEFDWQTYLEMYNSYSYSPPSMAVRDDDDTNNYENIISATETLAEHLIWQLHMAELTPDQRALGEEIINNINDDGFCEASLEEIAAHHPLNLAQAQEVASLIGRFDPVGCGAPDLATSLKIQAEVLGKRDACFDKIVGQHLAELPHLDARILQQEGLKEEELKEVLATLKQLNPRPGRQISGGEPQYIIPDIFVIEVGGKFVVRVNDEGVPRLKISNIYRSLLKQSAQDEAAQEYLADKIKSAAWLIKSIQNRQRTIVRVSEAIVARQQEFFRKGPAFLVPMVLRDIAGEIGMHESTVSRVTANKYMHTPLGIFELKSFFGAGVAGLGAHAAVSIEALKHKLKALINSESPYAPLSDQKLAFLLGQQEGIAVARRTVAKYREMLGIPTSTARKKQKK